MIHSRRSISLRIFIALFVVGLLCLAAFALWFGKELIMVLAIMAAVMWGFGALGDLLPLSSATRAGMAKRHELDQRYPVRRYRSFFWMGLGISIAKLWMAQSSGRYAFHDFMVPAGFMLIGLFAMLVWRFKYPQLARGA